MRIEKGPVMAALGILLLTWGMPASGNPDLSARMVAGVERYVQATRELNVAMMMIEKAKKEKDPRSAAYHALEGIGRLEAICSRMAAAHAGLRALEENMYARSGFHQDAGFQHLSGPRACAPRGIDVWSPDDWVTKKALDGLPELAAAAKKFFADLKMKLKIYAVYLVTHACPKSGNDGDYETCVDPLGNNICCHLKCLVRELNAIDLYEDDEPNVSKERNALCFDDTDLKRELAEEIAGVIDDLSMAQVEVVSKRLSSCDPYWAAKRKDDITVAAGEFTESGGWDYLNTVKDSFFDGLSSAWDKACKLGGGVTTVASGDYSGGMAMARPYLHGPAGNPVAFPDPAGPREGIAILAPDDKSKAPCLLTRVTFVNGHAVIPHTLQGPFTLYLYMPGYRPLIHKNLVVTEEEQSVPIQVVSSGGPAAALSLASDWNPKKDSTLKVPPVPPCDISQEVYHVEHLGEVDAENQAYRTRLRMQASFDLEFGQDEREIEKVVTYQVEHETAGKAFDDVRIDISPVHYTLEARVKWTARLEYKDKKKHLVVNLEVLDRGKEKLHWVISSEGSKPMIYDTLQDCMIDQVIGQKGLDTRIEKDDQVQIAGENKWFWEIDHDFPAIITPGGGPAAHIGTSHLSSRVDITLKQD